jgi:zinc transport system ATP-binding protein
MLMTSPAPAPAPAPGPASGPELGLDVEGAAFGYAQRAVVADVTMQVHRGEVVAILGANGSGKSTLVKGLLGLNDQLAGTVRFFGVERDQLTDRWRVGYVPQRHTLSGSVRTTVAEVVGTGRLTRRPWWLPSSQADAAATSRALALVDLSDRAKVDVGDLSGGQQRRVLIARALAAGPDVLLMDEPTAGVDAASQHGLAEVLARLVTEGVTMLVVTHELAAFSPIVTRVVVVDAGRVTFDGTPEAFAAAGRAVLHDHEHAHHADENRGDAGARPAPGLTPTTLGRPGGHRG